MQADSQHMMVDNCTEAFVKSPKSFHRLPPDSSAPAETAKTSHSFSVHRGVNGAGDGTGEREGGAERKWWGNESGRGEDEGCGCGREMGGGEELGGGEGGE